MLDFFHDKIKVKQELTGLKIFSNSWPGFSRTIEILNRYCPERKPKIIKFYIFMKRGFDTIILIYTENMTAPAGNRDQGLQIYVSVLWPQTEISDCPSRVSVAERSEQRYVDSGTLGSIPGWEKQIFSTHTHTHTHTHIYIYIYYIILILYYILYYILHVIYRIIYLLYMV